MTRTALPVALAALTLSCSLTGFAQQPTSESALWTEIQALRGQSDDAGFSEDWFKRAAVQRKQLVERLALYQLLYPGGSRLEDSVQFELQARFELATLANEYAALRQRIATLQSSGSPTQAAEAAYWNLLIPVAENGASPQGPPTTAPSAATVDRRLQDYTAYVRQHPRARHVPQLAALIFRSAQAGGDLPMMREIAQLMQREFREHGLTAELKARLRLHERIGQPFEWSLRSTTKVQLRSADFRGKPLVLCCWSAFEPRARPLLRELQRAHEAGDIRAIGIILDPEVGPALQLCEQELVRFPQSHDGLAGPFALAWGISETPLLLLVNSDGRLERIAEGLNEGTDPATAPHTP